MNKEYIHSLNTLAQERVYVPARINEDGTIENVKQAYVKTVGAKPGETNYKTRKRPTKYGKHEVEQGTFVANKHKAVKVLDTKEIDVDARILQYGRMVRRKNAEGWDGIFAQAAAMAAQELSARFSEAKANTGISLEETF